MLRNSSVFSRFVPFMTILMALVLAPHAFAQAASAWQLIWSDEFDGPAGSAPNPQHWTFQQGPTPDGDQSYNCLFGQTTNGCDPQNANVFLDGNGNLATVARAAAGAPNGVTSGRLATSAGTNQAIVKSFGATASSTGTMTIQFTTGAADLAKVSGIEVTN